MQINFIVLKYDENMTISVFVSIFAPALSHFQRYSPAPTSSSILYRKERKIKPPLL